MGADWEKEWRECKMEEATAQLREIARQIQFIGYYDHPLVGRLRPNTCSRKAVIAICVAWFVIAGIFLVSGNLRSASWQLAAIKANFEVTALRQALNDQQSLSRNNSADLATCRSTLDNYRDTLARVEQAQQSAASNAQAAAVLRVIQALKTML